MANLDIEADALLVAARERGKGMIGGTVVPAGLDHFTLYAGLIGSALDLGRLIQSEERDLKVIESYYQIEMTRITLAFREIKAAMIADFARDESLKEKTFEMIRLLIAAGQFEVAAEFHRRMIDSFHRPALESIIEHRNIVAGQGGGKLRLK